MKGAARVLLAGSLCIAASMAPAGQSNVQFSAQAVQETTDGNNRNARIYVGDNQVRLEYYKGELLMAEVYDMKNRRVLLMVPQQETYLERSLPEGGMINPMLPPGDSNPCLHVPQATCRKLAQEPLFGRDADKWEMRVKQKGRELVSLHWMDDERHMPLREQWPDGTVSELRPLGEERLDGRPVERWEKKTTYPDGRITLSTQWYDPELQIAVREELADGKFRALRDIRVEPQPVQLFEVPAGYRQLESIPAGAARREPPPAPPAH